MLAYSLSSACEKLVHVASVVEPESELVAKYEARYQQFRQIYPALKAVFPVIM